MESRIAHWHLRVSSTHLKDLSLKYLPERELRGIKDWQVKYLPLIDFSDGAERFGTKVSPSLIENAALLILVGVVNWQSSVSLN